MFLASVDMSVISQATIHQTTVGGAIFVGNPFYAESQELCSISCLSSPITTSSENFELLDGFLLLMPPCIQQQNKDCIQAHNNLEPFNVNNILLLSYPREKHR